MERNYQRKSLWRTFIELLKGMSQPKKEDLKKEEERLAKIQSRRIANLEDCKDSVSSAKDFIEKSALNARKTLAINDPVKILVDSSIWSHCRTHETKPTENETGWLMDRYPIDLESQYINDLKIYSSLQYLLGIKYLVQQDYLNFYTSALLEREKWRHPLHKFDGQIGWFDYSIFGSSWRKKYVKWIDPENFKIESDEFREGVNKIEEKMDENERKGEGRGLSLGPYDNFSTSYDKPERLNKRIAEKRDTLHEQIQSILGDGSSYDAWHVCTAENYEIPYFLTMDFRLIRGIKKVRKRVSLKVRILSPETLGNELGVRPVDPLLCELADRE